MVEPDGPEVVIDADHLRLHRAGVVLRSEALGHHQGESRALIEVVIAGDEAGVADAEQLGKRGSDC